MEINDLSRIVRTSWNQSNEIFQSGHVGHQCFAMVVVNLIRAAILPLRQWDANVLNRNMIAGDGFYK